MFCPGAARHQVAAFQTSRLRLANPHTQTRTAQLVELAHSKISRTNAEAPREHVERDARAQVLELPKPLGLKPSSRSQR